jgi:hypothetical protein
MQKSNQLWRTVLAASLLFMAPVTLAYGQGQKGTSAATDIGRTDSSVSGTTARHPTPEPDTSSQDERTNAKNTDPLNSSPPATNPETYQRDMEQRFPATNDAGADNVARSRDAGS